MLVAAAVMQISAIYITMTAGCADTVYIVILWICCKVLWHRLLLLIERAIRW